MTALIPAAGRRRRPFTRFVCGGLLLSTALGLVGCSSLTAPRPEGPVASVAVSQGTAESLISSYRTTHGLAPVALDPALQRAAQQQALAMASADELSHEVAGSLPHRLAANDLDRKAEVENVSAGYSTLEAAIAGWKRSPGHNENLLFGPMRRMGIAAASAPKTRYKTFWSLIMTN